MPSQLSNMVMMYLQNPELVETFLQYDNLDDYLDLMECDLRERYLEVRHMSENRNHTSLSQNIIMEICSVIRRFQKRIPHFERRGEVQITADLHDSVEGILNGEEPFRSIGETVAFCFLLSAINFECRRWGAIW